MVSILLNELPPGTALTIEPETTLTINVAGLTSLGDGPRPSPSWRDGITASTYACDRIV